SVGKVGLGLLLAVFLNQKLKTQNFLRTVYFAPCVLNNIAVGVLFAAMMHPTTGLINKILHHIGLGFLAQNWLTDPKLAIYSVASIEIWKWTGFTMVILLAGLQVIPTDYYEAAAIDGATEWQKFKSITIPLLMPALTNSIVVNLIGGLKVFDMIYATTQGGPGNATEVLNSYMFKSFGQGRYGEASASSVILSIIVAVVVVSSYSILTKQEVEL
ncbi:MAG: sugar ABC transporter permease, partial [Ruthenibacterium sp.]